MVIYHVYFRGIISELVDSSEVYVKFTKKQNFTLTRNKSYSLDELDTDFDVNYYTKEQYIAETKLGKQLSTRSIGAQEGGNSSWLKMTLQVYYGNGSNKYFAYNCCSWLTSPLCRFTDGIGITVSSHLIISGDSGSRHSEYIAGDRVNGERYYTNSYVDINQEGNGVLAKFGLYKDNMCWQGEFHNFMVQTGVNFAGYASTEGRISGHYVHKQVGVGSVSMNPTTGIPSVGIASSEDSVKASVYVSR